MKIFIILLCCLSVSCCAAHRPIVDMQGADKWQYERDLRECQRYAEQVSPGANAIVGGGLGACIGGGIGAIIGSFFGNAGDGAAIGASIGGAEGAVGGAAGGIAAQSSIINNCMRERGYKVLY